MASFQERLNECPRGTRMAIARACGITHGAVSQWAEVPAERVQVVEQITGIPRSELRPDLYPPEREIAPSEAA